MILDPHTAVGVGALAKKLSINDCVKILYCQLLIHVNSQMLHNNAINVNS